MVGMTKITLTNKGNYLEIGNTGIKLKPGESKIMGKNNINPADNLISREHFEIGFIENKILIKDITCSYLMIHKH